MLTTQWLPASLPACSKSARTVRESLSNFEHVEHRLEYVATVKGVDYINDSKATNVNSTWYALESIEKPIVWIVGGVDKGNDYEPIKQLVKDRVKAIVCLGKDNLRIHEAFASLVPVLVNTESMDECVVWPTTSAKGCGVAFCQLARVSTCLRTTKTEAVNLKTSVRSKASCVNS